ncbi:zinc finger MYM-type protein 1-like [Tachypleus tridentatus]|uniref:zinc finger MYM-type protein 1-like n=1 Tax=Tachypleus tridentatus TaxID=6853 RepID=UPI003FD4BA00
MGGVLQLRCASPRSRLQRMKGDDWSINGSECAIRRAVQVYDESNTSDDKGNYKEFLNTLRDYDTCLDSHLNTATVFQGTSPTVQNDLIQALSNVLKKHIKKEIDSARFVAIILDETSDVISKSQLSTVLRFVCNGKVFERFIGFSDVSVDRTADGLFSHVVDIAKEFEIENKLVGQTYDGASVMSGHMNGLQKKVLYKYPLAIFAHCYAHGLNLVLQQGLFSIKECRIFFQTLSGLSAFFSKSSKR